MAEPKRKILMITSEIVPFAKTGGLADAVGALTAELGAQGNDVRVVMPRYYTIDRKREGMRKLEGPLGIPMGYGEEWASVYELPLPGTGVPVYLLEHEGYFGRDGIYGSRSVPDFPDNPERFALLCRGAFQLCRKLGWIPDIMHAHDWPASFVPVFLSGIESGGEFARTASVLSIHNLGYQGIYGKEHLTNTGVPWEHFFSHGLEFHGNLNMLKAGIRTADVVTTVSPTYAHEIQNPANGFSLDGLLRSRAQDLFGILNGMDYDEWNPETDRLLPVNYSADDFSGKAELKKLLQQEVGLEVNPAVPLIGIVSRLADQKGFGELCGPAHGSLYSICNDMAVQVVILGTGEKWCEEELGVLESKLPNLRVRLQFNNRLAHLIEAGSDFFLMPSRYEPCGLNQMYSLRYGTLPVVRRTGGLADTVENYDQRTGGGTGFVFDNLTPRSIYDVVGWAVWAWYNRPEHITLMRRRAMAKRFSWKESAKKYMEVYGGALDRRLGRSPRT